MTTNPSPLLRTADGVDLAIARACELVLLVTGFALMGTLTAISRLPLLHGNGQLLTYLG
jgi:hypothetical protein